MYLHETNHPYIVIRLSINTHTMLFKNLKQYVYLIWLKSSVATTFIKRMLEKSYKSTRRKLWTFFGQCFNNTFFKKIRGVSKTLSSIYDGAFSC